MPARVSQTMTEVLSAPNAGAVRVSQVMVEVLHSLNAAAPAGGTTGKWFKDLECMDATQCSD